MYHQPYFLPSLSCFHAHLLALSHVCDTHWINISSMSLVWERERECCRERSRGNCMSMCAFVHLKHIQLATYQANQRWHWLKKKLQNSTFAAKHTHTYTQTCTDTQQQQQQQPCVAIHSSKDNDIQIPLVTAIVERMISKRQLKCDISQLGIEFYLEWPDCLMLYSNWN